MSLCFSFWILPRRLFPDSRIWPLSFSLCPPLSYFLLRDMLSSVSSLRAPRLLFPCLCNSKKPSPIKDPVTSFFSVLFLANVRRYAFPTVSPLRSLGLWIGSPWPGPVFYIPQFFSPPRIARQNPFSYFSDPNGWEASTSLIFGPKVSPFPTPSYPVLNRPYTVNDNHTFYDS